MTILNNNDDTITFTMDGDSTIPAFTTSTLSSYLNHMSITGNDVVCGSHSAGDTITLSNYSSGFYVNTPNGTAPTYTINGSSIHNSTYSYNGTGSSWYPYNSKPFEDNFPEWNAFRKLCEDYPGLEKAYENLKTIYTIVYADSLLPKEDK